MEVRELTVPGAWLFSPSVFPDARGAFAAPFQAEVFAGTVGHPLHVAQANTSVSRRGVLRGIHYADVPPGQAKYVQCSAGALLDVVVDLREGSPTFGHWDAVRLDGERPRAVYVAEGLGHAFLALAEGTVATYLCSTAYDPGAEHGVDPLDPAIGLPWTDHLRADELVLSDKDRAAPSLADARAAGALPNLAACRARRDGPRRGPLTDRGPRDPRHLPDPAVIAGTACCRTPGARDAHSRRSRLRLSAPAPVGATAARAPARGPRRARGCASRWTPWPRPPPRTSPRRRAAEPGA